jgi:predicted acylesterase/phospholipase RssA
MKRSLDHVREDKSIPLEEKRRFYRAVNKNYGASALCLSGGAGFGYYHFGVVKAFLEADLLPKVVTGTSAGGLVAALTCTRTDEELRELLVPELADRITACEDGIMWVYRRG